jgi:hypothetical protein
MHPARPGILQYDRQDIMIATKPITAGNRYSYDYKVIDFTPKNGFATTEMRLIGSILRTQIA